MNLLPLPLVLLLPEDIHCTDARPPGQAKGPCKLQEELHVRRGCKVPLFGVPRFATRKMHQDCVCRSDACVKRSQMVADVKIVLCGQQGPLRPQLSRPTGFNATVTIKVIREESLLMLFPTIQSL